MYIQNVTEVTRSLKLEKIIHVKYNVYYWFYSNNCRLKDFALHLSHPVCCKKIQQDAKQQTYVMLGKSVF